MTRYRKVQWLYILVDTLSAVMIWIAFLAFRWLVYDGRIAFISEALVPAFHFWNAMILYPIGCLLVYYLSGYYIRPLDHKIGEEFVTTFVSSVIIAFGAFFIIIIDDNVQSYQRYTWSLLTLFAMQLLGSWIPRLILTLIVQHFIGGDRRTVLVGDIDETRKLRQQLHGRRVDAVLLPSELAAFHDIKKEKDIQEVIIALSHDVGNKRLYKIIRRLYPEQVEISFSAHVYDMLTGAARIRDLSGEPLVTVTRPRMADWELCVKRAFDVVMSVLALIFLSPLMLFLALLVFFTSKGCIIYRQERIGMYGKPFYILKFRTMIDDAEHGEPQLSSAADSRITPVGRWLRRYRLDELPQFWNILRGEMSIVGPRPERRYFINKIEREAPYYCLIYKIRPGLTSWGPVRVGYTDTIEKMVSRLNYDIVYTENMSLGLDMKILFYTVGIIFNGKGQ